MDDARYVRLKEGLSQLNDEELQRIIDFNDNGGRMVCDTFIYDQKEDQW